MKKNAIILGDSYSTFAGFVPEGYAVWYPTNYEDDTAVRDVSQTWWHQVMEEANLNLLLNNSWSGSTVSYTGYYHVDCSETSSFIFRLKQLIENGFFTHNEIHKVFVFGGTNDSFIDAPLGEVMYSDWKKEDLYAVLPAICYFLHLLRDTLPYADIYCLINTELKPEITACLQDASKKYDAIPVTFESIDKVYEHPTAQGMSEIKNTVLNVLNRQSQGESL